MNEIETVAGMAPTPSYRYADVVGNRLFLAGQVPLDEHGRLIGFDDVGAQTRQCLTNLCQVVTLHGFAVTDIHQLAIHVVGPQPHLTAAWREVATWFSSNVPPATLLGSNVLGYVNQLVEIDARVERADQAESTKVRSR